MSKPKPLAWYSLEPHLVNLRSCGSFHLDPKTTPKNQYFLHQIYMRFCLSLPVLYSLQELIFIYQIRSDLEHVMRALFLFLSFVDSIYKQLVMWLKADKIEELLDIMKGTLLNQDNDLHRTILSKFADKARLTLRTFNGMTQATCIMWTLFPLIAHLKGSEDGFAIWLPFDVNSHSSYFYYVLFYTWFQTSLLGFTDSTMDAFISFSFAQCTTQLTILRSDLETLVERSKAMAKEESLPFTICIKRLFTVSLLHYHDVITLAKKTEDVFSGAVFCHLFVTGWIICTTVYLAISMSPASVEFLSMVLYMCCILLELFLYCFFGNNLAIESELLIRSAYNMNWLELPVEHRRSLIIFMERIKKPIQPMAGTIVPLSASTFLSVLRSSYTFYAFLKATEE